MPPETSANFSTTISKAMRECISSRVPSEEDPDGHCDTDTLTSYFQHVFTKGAAQYDPRDQ